MQWSNAHKSGSVVIGCVIAVLSTQPAICSESTIAEPIADAGLPRYAAQGPVVLDGTGSCNMDDSVTLRYTWRQISGPAVAVADPNTATPTISGFVQTNEIQECELELVVSDGELTSLPDTVKVIIVPDFGESMLRHVNPPFDPNKPTFVFFGGGDCIVGFPGISATWDDQNWNSGANVIDFSSGYEPDSLPCRKYTPAIVEGPCSYFYVLDSPRTYYRYGDMIIAYLSSVAPNYRQPIQTAGWSTGGQPAIDVGIHLNLTYADARYAINRVTLLDARSCREHSDSIRQFLDSSVDGEQCWIDNHRGGAAGQIPVWPSFYASVLRVGSSMDHVDVVSWYANSLAGSDMNRFNHGVVGGAYWSVLGPGKNLQLASTPGVEAYSFKWHGDQSSGYMGFYDEPNHPGRLPEPVTLVGPTDRSVVDANGTVLSCRESENAVGYQLLFGPDPYCMVYLFSETPLPPRDVVPFFPFEQTCWTVLAYDQYGSTIYADPLQIYAETVRTQVIENVMTGQRYSSIQEAINDSHPGDEIVVGPGACQHFGNINFKGKSLTLRSIDPNDPAVVATTVINGGHRNSAVTFCGGEEATCVLNGLTIRGGTVGICYRDASATIRNCTIESIGPTAIEFFYGHEPMVIDCTILGSITEVYDPSLVAFWSMDEIDGNITHDSIGVNDGSCHGQPLWQPDGGMVAGALQFDGIDDYVSTPFIISPAEGDFSVFAWINGGAAGQVILSQEGGVDWLMADLVDGTLRTDLRNPATTGREAAPPGPPLISTVVIVNGDWHRVGFVWNGSRRILYVDDIEVARDTATGLEPASGGLYIGAGSDLEPGTFWSGLIDDVRIYKRAANHR